MKKKLYLALSNILKRDTALSWVDWQKGQFIRTDQFSQLPLPAALVDIEEIIWTDGIMQQQTGTLTLSVDVYMSVPGGTHTDGENLAINLAALDLLDSVASTLQGLQSDGVQGLSRSKETRLLTPKAPNVIAYRLLFHTRVYEDQQPAALTNYRPSKLRTHGHISH